MVDSVMGRRRLQWFGKLGVGRRRRAGKYSGKRFSLLDQVISRRRAIACAVTGGIASGLYLWPKEPQKRRFQIDGPSMAPTLVGNSRLAECSPCGLNWPVDAAASEYGVCWHCGEPVRAADRRPADLVDVLPTDEIKRGQLVAFEHAGVASVKRIVAIPGDSITLHGLEVFVNNRTIDHEVILPVDFDDHRSVTRWSPDSRTEDRHWRLSASDSQRLIYHHQSVHDQNQPSQVYDDYAMNFGLTRPLETVHRLVIEADVIEASDDAELVCWQHERKSAMARLRVGSRIRLVPAQPSDDPSPTLAPESPLAIRMRTGTGTISRLVSAEADPVSASSTRRSKHLSVHAWPEQILCAG